MSKEDNRMRSVMLDVITLVNNFKTETKTCLNDICCLGCVFGIFENSYAVLFKTDDKERSKKNLLHHFYLYLAYSIF